MKAFYFIACLLSANLLLSQTFIEENYSHFLDRDDLTRVQVGERMFNIASVLTQDAASKEAHELVSKIKAFDLIRVPGLQDPQKEFKTGLSRLSGFEELVRIKDKDTHVAILVDESNGVVHELVGIIAADSEFVVFNLIGEIDLNEISKLTSKLQQEQLNKISGLQDLKIDEIKIYPNPSRKGNDIKVEVPENMVGGKVYVRDINSRTVQTLELKGQSLEISGSGLTSSNYFLEFENAGLSVKKKLIVIE
ncbi:MAG: DUF4252 domain-containing protein [Saprospiraceae bacterium]|nr:DUF4252 domain-containing protein [Saprospiraceae bacterium]